MWETRKNEQVVENGYNLYKYIEIIVEGVRKYNGELL